MTPQMIRLSHQTEPASFWKHIFFYKSMFKYIMLLFILFQQVLLRVITVQGSSANRAQPLSPLHRA